MSLGKKYLVRKRMAVNTYSHSIAVLEAVKSEDLRTLEFLKIPVVGRRCAENPNCTFRLLLGVGNPWGKQ